MEEIMAHLSKYQISEFFLKGTSISQQQCDQEAKRITGGSIHPAPVQGGTNYTVLANDGKSVVQFRPVRFALDLHLLIHIKQTYAGFVPHDEMAGRPGELYVYKMDNVGGVAMYLAREQLHKNNFCLLHRTVQDFAMFFASAWHNTPGSMPRPSHNSLFNQCSLQLLQLSGGLPARFRPILDSLIAKLPMLFADDWPLVPNHNDLLENNIHVNPETGQIVGVCDWKDTTIGPFGLSLGGLETMLGIRRIRGWFYHPNQQELRDLFWGTFYDAMGQVSEEQKELIEVARLFGTFLDYGFEGDDDGSVCPASEGHETLEYFEAVTLGLSGLTEE